MFDLKVVKYLDESKGLKTQSFICLCWLTSRQSNWLILARTFTKNAIIYVKTLRVIGWIPSQWELHIFYLFWSDFEAISLVKTRKNQRLVYLPPEKTKRETSLSFFSFGLDPLNWQSSIEIGAIACSTNTWCSRRLLNMFRSCYVKHSLKYFVAIYRETNINCWEREIVAWEKEITMRD